MSIKFFVIEFKILEIEMNNSSSAGWGVKDSFLNSPLKLKLEKKIIKKSL